MRCDTGLGVLAIRCNVPALANSLQGKLKRGDAMGVRELIIAATLLASAGAAFAQSPTERGKYLVNTIMTCQNCHTPKGERGAPIFERDLSSGLSWDEPPFKVTASNITQDKDTGIGSWTDADIMTALRRVSGRTACVSPRSCRRTSMRSLPRAT